MNELKEKEKLNPTDSTELREKLLERFDWTDTLLTEYEQEAVENILGKYHDVLAGDNMEIAMKTAFKVISTPKDDQSFYSQNLLLSVHLKEDLIVELVLMHILSSSQNYLSPSTPA